MLQQTQVSRVVPRYGAFLDRFPTLEALAEASLGEVLEEWLGLGYNNRALRLKQAAERAAPALPGDLDGLLALPGIGPYTARAVMVFAHNADLAAVDANVRRVLVHELGLPPGLPSAGLQAVADAALPRGRSRDWHNALMDYGSSVLTARATGIAPLTRQTPFAGSRRQYRARLVRLLSERGPVARDDVGGLVGLPADQAADVVAALVRDGMLVVDGGMVGLA